MRMRLALCFSSVLFALACKPVQAPSPPSNLRRSTSAPMDGGVTIVHGRGEQASCDDASIAQQPPGVQPSDADFPDSSGAEDASRPEDGGVGCAFITCRPGFECCPFDGRCNPVSCFTCCGFVPDVGPSSGA